MKQDISLSRTVFPVGKALKGGRFFSRSIRFAGRWRVVQLGVILLWTSVLPISAVRTGSQFKATDAQVSYIGRVERDERAGTVRYDWVGTYLRVAFTGTQIGMTIADEGESWHNVFIDGKWIRKIRVSGKTPQRILLASHLERGRHELQLQKCTEGEYGCTLVVAFDLPDGGQLLSVPRRERMIEFIGDSYTCGYGTESNRATDPFRLETENCDKAYACILARYFGADYSLVAHSGRGIIRNYGDTVQVSKGNMSQRYGQLFDEHNTVAYDFKAYRPDLVVINLGTNDFSRVVTPTADQYIGAYVKLIARLRRHYGEVPIICVTPHSRSPHLATCLRLLQLQVDTDKKVHFAEFMPAIITPDKDLGASYHPNYSGQKKLAMTLIPLVSAVMGWDLETWKE